MCETGLLKILCLHGYRQNANTFRRKLGGFRRACRKQAQFVFVDAPHVVPQNADIERSEEENANGAERGWWLPGEDVSSFDEQLRISFQTVADAEASLGPFDGILGFSQGASLLGYYLVDPTQKASVDFAMFAAKSPTRPHLKSMFASHKITIPTLHVFGESDDICPMKDSTDFLEACDDVRVVMHPGGHFMPAAAPQKKAYVSFLNEVVDRRMMEGRVTGQHFSGEED